MERIHLTPDGREEEIAAKAAAVLRAGGIALLPAEGVYGLHVLAADGGAVERLRGLKPREVARGYIGLIASPGELETWAKAEGRASELARIHWPGALTLVLEAKAAVPASLRTQKGTVALRCPGSDFLRSVVAKAGGPVISTSANAPGEAPLIRPEGPMIERVDLVVDCGELQGIPSTVVEIQGDWIRVLREGSVRIGGRSS